MARAKQVVVQAVQDGAIVFDRTVEGKTNQRALLRDCMEAIDSRGGEALIRTQVVGARGWAVYRYRAGEPWAHLDPSAEFPTT